MGDRWETRLISDLIEEGVLSIGDGYRAKNSELAKDGLPFARAGNLNNRFDFAGCDRVPDTTLVRVGDKRSCVGDVVFTSKGTVGRVGFVTDQVEPFVYSPQLCFWRSRNPTRLIPRFLYFWFHAHECRGQISALKSQTDMADYVSLRDQRNMLITLPSWAEQHAIADVLGTLDDKIESNLRASRLLTGLLGIAYGMATMRAEAIKLGDLGTVVGGGTPKSSVAEYWDQADIAWVTPKDMTALGGNPCIWEGTRMISRAGLRASSAKLVPAGSVLYTSRATLGLVAVAQQDLATNQGFITVVPRPGVSSAFVFSTLMAQADAINAKANGSTFLEVNKTNFKQVECPWPDAAARAEYDAVAGPVLRQIAVITREAQTLTAIRNALLPRLVSGQIHVPLSGDLNERVGMAVDALR